MFDINHETNQKYFPLFDSEYKLTNRFLIISNINLENPKNIIEGNQRVIMPRLKDAEFFYEIDRRQSLHGRIPMLKKVLFQNKLGTQYERIMRLHSLSGLIAGILKYDKVNAQRAGLLCKVDLLTEMVGEFPLLQGIMGKYYAHNDEEADLVCDAIQEHYLPRFHGDSIPSAEISVCVALADKIDLLIGIFGIGLEPTGEKDPYALRRAGLGIARIIIENDIEIDLLRLLDLGVKNLSGKIKEPNIARNVFRFIIDRIRTYMKEKQFLSDEIEAVIRKQPKKINDLLRKVDATRQFKESDHFSKLAASNKRIEKIIKNNLPEDKEINISLFKTEAERNLHRKIIDVSSKVKELNLSKKFRGVFTLVATLNPEIDDFFDKVLVMDENPEKRKNNFILLSELHRLLNNVAFLSELN